MRELIEPASDALSTSGLSRAEAEAAAIETMLRADQQTKLDTAPLRLSLHEAPIRFFPTYKLDKVAAI